MPIALRIDQLHVNGHAIADTPDAAFENVRHTESVRDLLDVTRARRRDIS